MVRPHKLRLQRLLSGMTLYDVENQAEISTAKLSLAERGYRQLKPSELARLAKIYGVTPKDLGDGV